MYQVERAGSVARHDPCQLVGMFGLEGQHSVVQLLELPPQISQRCQCF